MRFYFLVLSFLLFLGASEAQLDGEPCSLCQDGSSLTKPDGIVGLNGEEWKCSELEQILWLLGVTEGGQECATFQFRGFVDCGCPTFQDDNLCTLCPRGVSSIPDPNITIPGHGSLTCGDIVIAQRDDPLAPIPCDQMGRYTQICRCPESCSFCRYSDESPTYPDRIIPYLTEGDKQVTCAARAIQTSVLVLGETCDAFKQAPVPVNVEGYCGCPISSPSNLCSLCPDGGKLRDPNMVIPNVGGLTCSELEEYLRYVTDLDSCTSIAARSQVCCGSFEPCPICPDGSYGLGSGKVYGPYSLGCDQIGQATHFGFPLTCETAQQRFPFFCGCEGVFSECTICPLNQVPPEPSRFIPLLNLTCGEANDFVSLRSASECTSALTSFKVNVAAFCGCSEDTSLFGRCAFCPQGQGLIYWSDDRRNTNIFGTPATAGDSTTIAQNCQDLETMAPYVIDGEFCQVVQESIPDCCRPFSTEAPTFSAPPAIQPTVFPTFQPTSIEMNASFWENITTAPNITNDTPGPTTAPPATIQPTEESSASTFKRCCRMMLNAWVAASMALLVELVQ